MIDIPFVGLDLLLSLVVVGDVFPEYQFLN